jgi:hypothetical protein
MLRRCTELAEVDHKMSALPALSFLSKVLWYQYLEPRRVFIWVKVSSCGAKDGVHMGQSFILWSQGEL